MSFTGSPRGPALRATNPVPVEVGPAHRVEQANLKSGDVIALGQVQLRYLEL